MAIIVTPTPKVYDNYHPYDWYDNILTIEDAMVNFTYDNFDQGALTFENEYFKFFDIGAKLNELKVIGHGSRKVLNSIKYSQVKKWKFSNCTFPHDVNFFKDEIDTLIFDNCTFEKRCYINNQYDGNKNKIKINTLIIKKTTFKHNFKLHNTEIGHFQIQDSDFEENADFFKSKFKARVKNRQNNKFNYFFNAINFHKLALFGDTEFNHFLEFRYVTFRGYTHFRGAKFDGGLNLEYANIEKEMNFFNIKKLDKSPAKDYTGQETYRIVKYQLQKVGNIIDSNNYHSLELKKRRENIKIFPETIKTMNYYDQKQIKTFEFKSNKFSLKNFIVKMPLLFHWISSNHSTNWFLSLFWIMMVGLITWLSIDKFVSHEPNYTTNLIDIFKYISFINFDMDIKENPIIFVLNKVSLGYLYYQFLTAIRKDTRK